MNALIELHRREVEELCHRFHVSRLDLFGSAATGTFKPDASDLDFLVTFATTETLTPADQYFGLLGALESLFCCRIDLVTHKSRRNPYFIRATDATGVNLYAS